MPDQPIEPGSITQTSDAQNERISEVSSVSNTINAMQQDVDQRLTEVEQMAGDSESVAEVQTATVGILHKMQETMGSFAQGINAITIGTATATKDAISQYGKAISEDISYNKQSVVAMALSRSTPIFGYFAAKFMETDVFQKAKGKMAESLKSVFSGVGKTISGFLKGKKEGEDDIPKMQSGGYVKKGGMVEVHAGEIVAPIEKVLSRIDESVSAVQEIGVTFKRAQLHNMANMAGYVKGQQKMEKVGLFKGFLRAMNQVQTQYEEPAQTRMLRALLSIQDTLGATIGTWQQVWTKMLVEHPTFRNIVFGLKSFTSVFTGAGKIAYRVFKARGGYKSQLPHSDNPFENISLILGLMYAESMHRLDNIVLNTRHSAWAARDLSTYVTGKTYPPLMGTQKTLWSIMGVARKMLNVSSKWMPAVIAGGIDIMFGGSGKAGWKKGKSVGDFFSKERKLWGSTLYNSLMDLTASRKMEKSLYGELPDGEEIQKALPEASDDAPMAVRIVDTSDKVKKVEDKKWRDEKKGGENLLSGVNSLYDANVKQHKKEFKLQKATAKDLDQMNKRGKFKSFISMIGGAFNAAKSIIGGLLDTVMDFLGLKKGGLGFLMSAKGFASFLGPAAGILMAAGLGVAIGTWLNTYLGPWLNKKWLDWMNEGRAAHEKVVQESWDSSKEARKTAGKKGFLRKVHTSAIGSVSQPTTEGMQDPRHGKIIEGQASFIKKNLATYGEYDVNSFKQLRESFELQEKRTLGAKTALFSAIPGLKTALALGGGGTRLQAFGIGEDPLKYGIKKEERFLEYLQKHGTKKGLEAQAKEWTETHIRAGTAAGRKAQIQRLIESGKVKASEIYNSAGEITSAGKAKLDKLFSEGKIKGTEAYEKVKGAVKDKAQIAADYAKDAKAKGKDNLDALAKLGEQQLETAKDLSKNMTENIGTQTTSLVNTVSDNSQKMVQQGGKASANLYQDLKKTVITGRVDMDTLEMFWD